MRARDLDAAVRLVREGRDDDRDPGAPLPWSVLAGLRQLVPCEAVILSLHDSVGGTEPVHQELPEDPDELDPAEALPLYYRHYWDCAPCSYFDRTGDLDRVVTVSDFYSVRQFRRTGMWSEYLRPYGIAREMLACLDGVPGRTLRLILWRGPGSDFTDRDRALIWLLRPHLLRLYRERRAPRRTPLTPRQRELLRLVGRGHTNGQIAHRLGITESTVRKHLEHVFARLDVDSRTAAVARAFPDGIPET
jgi:DNA-binding CsgD family transcriptional regulator